MNNTFARSPKRSPQNRGLHRIPLQHISDASNGIEKKPTSRLPRIPLQHISDASNGIEKKPTSRLPVFQFKRGAMAPSYNYLIFPAFPDNESDLSLSQIEQEVTQHLTVVIPGQEQGNHIQVPHPSGRQTQERWSLSGGDSPIDRQDTLPMLVLKGLAQQQNQSSFVMKAEVTEAAGAAGSVGVGNLIASALKYMSNLMIQRGFGASLYGLYSLSMAFVTLVLSLFTFGMDNAMIRYVAIYRGKRQPRLLQGIVLFATAVAGVLGVVGALILLYTSPFIANFRHSPDLIPVLQVLAPLVPLLTLQATWAGGLQGFKTFKGSVIAQRLLPAISLIFFLGLALVFYHNVIGVVIATILSTIVGLILSLYYLLRKVSVVTTEEREEYELRKWLGFALPNFLSSIVDVVLQSIDTLLLAFYSISYAEIGLYTAAFKITTFITIPLNSLNTMFAPTIAELYNNGEHEKLLLMFKLITKWSIMLSLPIIGIVTLFAEPLLSLSGNSFLPAWPLLLALSVSSLANISTGPVGIMLLMAGYQKFSFYNSIAAVVINLVLGIILTPHYGAMGVAISTGLAFAVVNVIRLFQVYILLKMQPYSLDTLKPVTAGLVSAAVTGVLLLLTSHFNVSLHIGHLQLSIELLLIPVFLAGYFGLLSRFKLSPEDRIVVDALRKKFKRRKKKKGM
jgi:O-antigen/teichoic acid export membrane protein